MAKKYFGTDGIRGRVGEHPITADFMLRLGWAAGKVFAREGRGRIIIGKGYTGQRLYVRVGA